MDDFIGFILTPLFFIFRWLFKAAYFLVTELVHDYIAWSIGWCVCRAFSFGYYPKQGIWHDDKASIVTGMFVHALGYGLLIVAVVALMLAKIF